MYSAASQVPQKNDALSDGLLESWVGTQQIRVNCYRAFHSADQVQDHNALLKSMHIQRVKSSCLRNRKDRKLQVSKIKKIKQIRCLK